MTLESGVREVDEAKKLSWFQAELFKLMQHTEPRLLELPPAEQARAVTRFLQIPATNDAMTKNMHKLYSVISHELENTRHPDALLLLGLYREIYAESLDLHEHAAMLESVERSMARKRNAQKQSHSADTFRDSTCNFSLDSANIVRAFILSNLFRKIFAYH